MGKRVRSLGIQFGDNEIHLTAHSAWRFRNRIMGIPTAISDMTPYLIGVCAKEIRPMIAESTLVLRRTKSDRRIYLSHSQCVFVMTPHGTIVTVLRRSEGNHQFAESVKEVRRSKRTAIMRDNQRSRWRRINRELQRDPQSRHNDHEHDED